ncbi:diguanylate cyclase/phosphodiesterase [Salinisphaera sp. S4-8]|uniref:putative bifunctional diguanylate cyclase/phosphodiesterase n=1 Tax=Salinisphaera sp. S4-8 TaxID=633357 RepID=UPI003340B9B4
MTPITYHLAPIVLAVVISSVTCYAAIDILSRVRRSHTRAKSAWLIAGACVLSTGVWSMHFISILAVKLPFTLGHEFDLTFLSWLATFVAALLFFVVASRPTLSYTATLAAALPIAAGAWTLFYLGNLSLQLEPAIHYHALATAGSALAMYILVVAGLRIVHRLTATDRALHVPLVAASSLGLGIALALCHHLGLSSLRFPGEAISTGSVSLDPFWLSLLVSSSTLFLIALGVFAALLDRQLDRQTADLVTSLRKANAQLRYRSHYDTLTGLPNRASVYERIQAATATPDHNRSSALLYIDLDGFKLINDSLGHAVGDMLLQRASDMLCKLAVEQHMLGRIGGDEFLLLMEDVDEPETAEAFAQNLLAELAQVSERGATLSASIGIALFPTDAADATALITAADLAMYTAKRAGKNRVRRYLPSMGLKQAEAFQIQDELRAGIDNDELVVYYQPKYRTADGGLAGAEALVRWQHPTRGLVSPGLFIEVAERSGLINDLELCVIDQVCRQIRRWRAAGFQVPPVSINLSVARLLDERLIDQIRSALARHELTPDCLILEITETLAMEEFETATRVLGQLSDLGIRIALDDFGTGYSSLSYLQKLPIHQLKVDRSFTASLDDATSTTHSEIVKLIINLSHVLGITVVAEGVETRSQQRYLTQAGCDELQGYLLDRPMPAEEYARRLSDAPDHRGVAAQPAQGPAVGAKDTPLRSDLRQAIMP